MSLADDFLADVGPASEQPPAPRRALQPPQPLSPLERLASKVPSSVIDPMANSARGIVTYAGAPVTGIAQAIANVMPDSTGVPQMYNRAVNRTEEAAKDAPLYSKLTGAVISPANMALALRAPVAANAGARAIEGAKLGGATAAASPVETGESGKFWGPKAVQTAVGAGIGATATPLIGLVGDKVGALINRASFNPANAGRDADQVITSALKEAGQRLEDIPADQLGNLRRQVTEALSQGKQLDAAAAMRAMDFQREGIQGTLGQVTRDPMQWAAEQNVKGVKGAGEKLTQRFSEGNTSVSSGIGKYGLNASEASIASPKLADALRTFDAGKRAEVTQAYKLARESGAGAELPLQGLAQDFAGFVDTLPESVRKALPVGAFEKYGLSGGKQTKAFTYDDAENLLQTLNASKNNDPAVGRAIGKLSGFVKDAISQGGDGGPFAGARSLAAQRFKLHDEVPALAAAVEGQVDDTFVQKHVINSKSTAEVKKLADLLRANAPEAYQETRQQIGAYLARSAFGENVSADKQVAQESYNRALRSLGTGKLEAFFEPAEVEQMKRLGRIASYQNSPPAASASNYSNTSSAIANLLRSAGGYLPVGRGTVQFAGDKIEARAALNPEAPMTANLTPVQRALIAKILGGTGAAVGVTSGRVVGEQP
jgi:hypothetical protein